MKRISIFALLVVSLLIVACTPKLTAVREVSPSETWSDVVQEAPPAMMPESKAGGMGEPVDNGLSYAPEADVPQERLVIKNADVTIVVADPKAKMSDIAALANAMGGWVVSSNLYQRISSMGVQIPEGSITIRVPSEKLDEALAEIEADAVDVRQENISGQDVTDEYVDLQSRLSAKEAAAEKLREIMEDATDTQDVLAVYNQLQSIESDIEVLKGRIRYYEQSAHLSAISVRLIAEESVQPIEIGGWKLKGTVNDAVQDLIRYVQRFTRFLLRAVLFYLPALLLFLLPIYLVYLLVRAWIRRYKAKKAAKKTSSEGKADAEK